MLETLAFDSRETDLAASKTGLIDFINWGFCLISFLTCWSNDLRFFTVFASDNFEGLSSSVVDELLIGLMIEMVVFAHYWLGTQMGEKMINFNEEDEEYNISKDKGGGEGYVVVW